MYYTMTSSAQAVHGCDHHIATRVAHVVVQKVSQTRKGGAALVSHQHTGIGDQRSLRNGLSLVKVADLYWLGASASTDL